jgi:predicted O-methyltransferase YrrM
VGALPQQFAAGLRDRLGLTRAIETGTYRGGGTRRLASIFPRVITVEISEELARAAAEPLADVPGDRCIRSLATRSS